MRSLALASGEVKLLWVWFGFHGCCTSLQYGRGPGALAPKAVSEGPTASVTRRRVSTRMWRSAYRTATVSILNVFDIA